MSKLALLMALLLPVFTGCEGDFDQRIDDARQVFPGQESVGTTINPIEETRVAGVVSVAGAVKFANVTLRPINLDGTVDWDNNNALGQGVSDSGGVYSVYLLNESYRGPILVEVSGKQTGSVNTQGANPATATSNKWHTFGASHRLYSVLPYYDGVSVDNIHVSVFTTVAVARCLSFSGVPSGVQGGIATGLYNMCTQQVAEFFGLDRLRTKVTNDFAASGQFFGNDEISGWAHTALSQVAADVGVSNTFDFYLGMYQDMLDDGQLNASIGSVPNTGVPMPNLSNASLIGDALLNNFMAPLNTERVHGGDNTTVTTGSTLDTLITTLNTTRNINAVQRNFDLVLRVPGLIELSAGQEVRTSILAVNQIGSSMEFNVYGDSAGPSFVDFGWTSSSPANVFVNAFGRVTAAPAAVSGSYTLTLIIAPKLGQTFVSGTAVGFTITVVVK